MYINKALIYGNLTRDPELKKLPSGSSVVNVGVATNRVWNDQNNQKREEVEFHNIVIFGKMAELVSQYLKKGSGVFIEGRLQTRSWEAEGTKKYMTEIVAERVQFGPKSASSSTGQEPKDNVNSDLDNVSYPAKQVNPEDIPF